MWRRWLAGVLGAFNALNGVVMLTDGKHWYDTVPGVVFTGPYNAHFVQDIGAAFLAAGLGLAARAWRPRYWAAAVTGAAFLAMHAWSDAERGNWPPGFPEDKRPSYSLKEIRHWLQIFVQRFYSFSQFKRSALPNGPKVSHGGALSPRGDWRAPSDMSARIWLDEIEREVPED